MLLHSSLGELASAKVRLANGHPGWQGDSSGWDGAWHVGKQSGRVHGFLIEMSLGLTIKTHPKPIQAHPIEEAPVVTLVLTIQI